MYFPALTISVVSGIVAYYYHTHRRIGPSMSPYVIIDPWSVSEARRLVRLLTASDPRMDADTLSSRLERLFKTFPPTESTLRRLSMMQQVVSGTGGEDEFCVVMVFAIAMICVPTKKTQKPKRVRSLPSRTR